MTVKKHQYFYTYDTVGSFLIPNDLKEAYNQVDNGEITQDEFKQINMVQLKNWCSRKLPMDCMLFQTVNIIAKTFLLISWLV
ncbi:MAG: hypothetical protein LKJ37_05385 [Ligilactobacillus acidipiscis]|jgi:hypothetical protein|nr:hypothetical protein [Ligilactobacillus acidipiscis]MCI1954393.1 hypothetical protein [Ligilactobacillus acidipiscis]